MANLEQQWASLNLQRSLTSTPDIDNGELSESDRNALSITDRLVALNENAKLKAEKLRIASEAINQQTNQQTNQQNDELDTSSLDKFTAGLQNKNIYGANYDSATALQESLGSLANYGLQTDNITGQRFYIDPTTKQRVDYFGKEKGLYIAETDEGQMKLGLRAQGKTFADRYTPDWKQYVPFMKGYGWKPGDEGVNPNKDPYLDIDLPENLAVAYEKYVHSNAGQLAERTAGQGLITEDWSNRLGAGKTEYTTRNAPMWNVNYDTSAVNLQSDTPLPGSTHSEPKFDETGKYIGSGERTTGGAILDTIQALPAGFAKSVYDVADTTTELVGDLAGRAVGAYDEELGKKIDKTVDLGNEKFKGAFASKITGYDDKYSAKKMDEVKKHIEKATKDVSLMEPSTWNNISGSELASAAATAFSTPETAAYSLGYMVPALFGLGKKAVENVGSNVLKTYSKAAAKIEKSDVAPEIKIAKINELTDKLTLNDKTKMFLANNADAMAYGAMMNNDQMDEYIALNGGEEPTIARSLGGFIANSVGMKLDTGVMNSILKPESGDLASNVAKMFSNVDKETSSKIMAKVVEFSTRAASAGIKEMPQEWTQGFIEGFNRVYGTNVVDENKNPIGEKVSAEMAAGEKTRLKATTGAIAGLAGGAHTSMATQALGGMPKAVSSTMEKINESVDKIKQNRQNKTQSSEPGVAGETIDDNIDDETDTIELDDDTRTMHETNFNDAIAGLDELDSKTIDTSTDMKEIAKHVADIGKIDTLLKSSIVSGAITDADARKTAIARLNANNRRIKDAITGTITSGDEKAMNDLFSDPITSEKMLRSVADELDFDDTKIESNFMKAGYNAGLDEATIKDTIEESKIVRRLSKPSDYQTGKTAEQVASEVSVGKSGYLTYRNNVLDGVESGNINKINRNIEKLEKFANAQSEKLSKLTAGLNSVEDAINNQIDEEIASATKSDQTITREQVLQNYIDGKVKGQLQVQTSSKANDGKGFKTSINYSDVAKRMSNPDYNGGIYSIINSVEQESKDLTKLNELTQKQASRLPEYNKQFEAENEVDYKNRIKQLDSDAIKGDKAYSKYDSIDIADLNNELAVKVKEYRKNKAELKELKAKLEKLESEKQDKTKTEDKVTETNTDPKPSEPVKKRVIADDIVAPAMPKNTEFVAPQMSNNEQANTPGSDDSMPTEPNPFAKENKTTETSPFAKPTENKKVETKPTVTSGSESEIKFGSVVKYNDKYYIVRGYSASGALKLTAVDGTNFSGTPMPDKVKFAKQLTVKSYNNVNYAIDSNNNAYTSNGKVSKEYADKVISLGSNNETKQTETKKVEPDNKSTKVTADGLDMSKYPMPKATVTPSFVGNVNDFASSIPTPDEVAKVNAEFEKAPVMNSEKSIEEEIANFENLDSVDAAEKSEVVKELENELAIAKDKIKSTKANIEKVKLFKQKSYENKDYDNVDNAQMLIENYYASIDSTVARIDAIKAKLSGSAEIDSILKTSLSSGLTQSKMYDDKGKEIVGKFQKISAKDIIESSRKTSNRLSGMKIDEITQDAEIKAYADDAVKTIANMLQPIKVGSIGKGDGVVKPILETFQIRDDLFRGLLFNADGTVNRNMAVAVAMAADEMRALMHSKLAFNSREDVMNMLGYSQEFEVSNAAYNALAFEGKFKKLIADDLATAIFNNIAIKGKDNADIELVAKMRADAGQVALLYMQEKNYIEKLTESTITVELYKKIAKNDGDEKSMTMQSNEFDSDGKTIPMVRLKKDRITIADRKGDKEALAAKEKKIEAENKKFDETTNRLKKELDRMNDLLAIESTKKNVKFKPSVTTDKKVKNSKVSNMNDDSLKTLNILQAEAFEMNEGVEFMFELIDNGTIGEAQLLKIMGYETTKDLEGKAYDTVESAIARNGEILDSLNELKALRARVEDPNDDATNELYFDYFFGKNGRYYLDSVGINPQTGKELYRWLVTPKAHNIEINFGSQEAKDNQHENFFKLGIAQAFGYGIDKEETANAYAFAEAVMMQDESELLKVFTNENNTHTITGSNGKEHNIGIDHVGHTMQAIAALRKYREADNGKKPFTASLSIEFDAVTSGFILKLLQLPILEFKELKKWLKKGGIFLGSEAELADIKSTNDEIALGKLIDSYRTLASEMKDDKHFELDVNIARNGSEIPFKRKLFDAMKPLLGSLKEEFDDGINGIIERVTKEGRELFKYQFMPFNYSAGLKALNKNLGYEMIKNLPDMMSKDGMTKDSKARKLINALHGRELKDSEVSDFIKKLQDESFENIEILIGKQKIKVGEQMRLLIEDVYGSQVNAILTKEFSELMSANKTVNNAFKAVFMAWKSAYDKEIETLRASGKEVTNAEVDEIVEKLKDKFPMIKAPLSTDSYLDDSSAIAIHNTKLSSNKSNTYGPAKTYVNPEKNNGQATLTVQSMIREFSEAINSGSVIPIHYIDGSFMTKGLAKGGILGVHDAKVVGVGNALSATKDYNENVLEGSKEYSYINELFNLLERIRKDGDYVSHRNAVTIGSGENALTFNDVYNEVKELNNRVKNNRTILFRLNSKVMHMSAIEGTDYSNDGLVDTEGWIDPVVEETSGSEDKSKKLKTSSSAKAKESTKSEARDANKLYRNEDGTIRFGNNTYTKEVKSFDELIDLSNQFDELMQVKQNVAKSGTDVHNYLKDLWKMIAKSGVEFKPVKIQFVKKIDVGGLGVHKMYNGKTKSIQLSYNEEYQAIESPIRIMMHEYVHALTVTALRNNPELMALANKLRDHAIKEVGIDKVSEYYGFSDTMKDGKLEPHEFIAELMTSPRFQKLLSGIKGLGNKDTSLFEQVKKVFNAIINYVSKDSKLRAEASALTDGLQIVYRMFENNTKELLSSDTKEKEKQTNTTDEQALIDDAYSIIERLTGEVDEFETEIQDRLEVILDNIKGCR